MTRARPHTQNWRRTKEFVYAGKWPFPSKKNRTYCVHFASIREILDSQDLENKISRYPEGARVHIEYFHEVAAGTAPNPRNLWLRKMDPVTGEVTITNSEEDPWDTNVLLFLPDGASPVNPGPDILEIYGAMVIGSKARERDFIVPQM